MKVKVISIFLIVFLISIVLSGDNDIWKSCCQSGCDYSPGQNVTLSGKTYYCCNDGWKDSECSLVCKNIGESCSNDNECCSGLVCINGVCNKSSCESAIGTFSSRCPSESISISLTCESGKVCIYKISNVFVCDNTNKQSNVIESGYYCIDKKSPYYIDIFHKPELIANKDDTYDPYPNYYIDKSGSQVTLTPDKLVIDLSLIHI